MDRDNIKTEPNFIVNVPCKHIRAISRSALKNNWIKVTLVFVLYYIFTTLVSNILSIQFSYEVTPEQMTDSLSTALNLSSEQIDALLSNMGSLKASAFNYGGVIYEYIVCPAFNLGLCMCLFEFFRKHKVNITMIFDGMSYWAKAVILMFLMTIKTILWGMLFVVPGIIAAIRYSLSFFVMADHPDWTASMCIRESCRLMRGNKLKMVLLYVSFFGWFLLSGIPNTFIGQFVDLEPFMRCFTDAIFAIPIMILSVYIYISIIVFYELASGNLKIKRLEPQKNDMNNTEAQSNDGENNFMKIDE